MYVYTFIASVSYRVWGTWDFPTVCSSFHPQALLTSAITISHPKSIMTPPMPSQKSLFDYETLTFVCVCVNQITARMIIHSYAA